jgi:hypothetical protein
LSLNNKVREVPFGHLGVGQNRFNSLFGQVVNFDDLERLFFFVGSWVIMVDPEIAQFMVKNQKLIQLNIS